MRPPFRRTILAALATVAALAGPAGAEAATAWCGTAAAADRPALATGPHVRVVYAVAADGTDRSAALAPEIWADVEAVAAWWRANDGSRAVNFDLAAFDCGPQIDLTVRRIALDAAELATSPKRFALIRDDLFGDARTDARHAKYLLYYDGPTAEEDLCGEGGGSPGGTGLAIMYVQACRDVTRASVAAHELLHALGTLRGASPPNACPGDTAHVCDSTGDILYPYAQPAPLSSFVLDVGRDDYYAHPHSWFDLRTSLWLRHLDRQVPLRVAIRGNGSVRSDGPGLDCAATCGTAWNPGSPVTIRAVAARGQRFVRWGGACVGTGPRCDLLLDDATRAAALFAPVRFRLNVQIAGRGRVSGPGVACSRTCNRQLTSHRTVTLRATAARGWRLRGWIGACRGSRPTCTVPMTRASSVRATFVRRAA